MKSVGASLEFYMILWRYQRYQEYRYHSAERHTRAIIIVLIKLEWRYCLILYLHMIQIYSIPRYSVKRGTNTSKLGNKAIPPRFNVNIYI